LFFASETFNRKSLLDFNMPRLTWIFVYLFFFYQLLTDRVECQNFTGKVLCPKEITQCSKSKYYLIDGTCNNIKVSWAGKHQSPYQRLLPSLYDDGIGKPRAKSIVDDQPLPNPRQIAIQVHYPIPSSPFNNADRITHFNTMFGQFVAFDLTKATPTAVTCSCAKKNPDCINIPTPKGDLINSDQKCITTARTSSSFPKFDCKLAQREQLNDQTAWLDLSQLYGTDKAMSQTLRGPNGLLITTQTSDFSFQNLKLAPKNTCKKETTKELCFVSGDPRINENMITTSIATIWAREHNQIAVKLKKINPHWGSERIFQEARRILIAIYQKIVFNDFLPTIIGKKLTKDWKLLQLDSGYLNKYNPKINPAIYNEFGVAAWRFGHTLVQTGF
jgi:peroxidase